MQKTIISLITGIIVGLFPVIYSNWVNSGDLKYELSYNEYDHSIGIIDLYLENNSNKIEKNLEIRLPISHIEKSDIKFKSTIQDLKLDIFNDEIRFTAPSLRQNTENKISILVIQEPLYISAYSIDKISVTTENTIGSQPYYLFSKAHKENTIFILIFTTLGSLIILLIIAFVIDILTPYKKKKPRK